MDAASTAVEMESSATTVLVDMALSEVLLAS
jgi:hypothetical protein